MIKILFWMCLGASLAILGASNDIKEAHEDLASMSGRASLVFAACKDAGLQAMR